MPRKPKTRRAAKPKAKARKPNPKMLGTGMARSAAEKARRRNRMIADI